MSKRVLLSAASPGLAAVDAALADLATDASGDSTKALYGDGTFKAPGGGAVQSVTVSLSSAQLLALNTSPVTIIPAPGAGSYILILVTSYELIYGSSPYSIAGDPPGLCYGGHATYPADEGGWNVSSFTGSSNSVAFVVGPGSLGFVATSNVSNQPVKLVADIGNPTGGNGTGKITVLYTTVTL
jgi:hypothetical protein